MASFMKLFTKKKSDVTLKTKNKKASESHAHLFLAQDWSRDGDGKAPWRVAEVNREKTDFIFIICSKTNVTILWNPKTGSVIIDKTTILSHNGITWSTFSGPDWIKKHGPTISVHQNGSTSDTKLRSVKNGEWGVLEQPFCKYTIRERRGIATWNWVYTSPILLDFVYPDFAILLTHPYYIELYN
jgi:hypothetical protein